jgi:hypothetical protein
MQPGIFSFIGDEFENLFRYSELFLPGIEQITGIYFSQRDKQLTILSRKRNEDIESNYEDLLQKRENVVMIQKFRTDSHPYTWIRKDDLPFEMPSRKKGIVPTLFTEFENIILVIRFENPEDHLFDLLFVYLNQNLGNFGLNKAEKVLSTDNKTIIGHLLYYQFKSFLQMNTENLTLLRSLNKVVRSVIHENSNLKELLHQVQSSFRESIVAMAQQYLNELSEENNRSYFMSDDAIEKIRNFKGNLKHLPTILRHAVIFTENLMMPDEKVSVGIYPYSLDFESYQVDDKPDFLTRKIDSRQSRAVQLLDKLERAAKILQTKNIPLIGSKVGKAMDPPVSAPAITDALGKNRVTIRELLIKYPDKWEIIRKEFKPLLNQLSKSNPDTAAVESA